MPVLDSTGDSQETPDLVAIRVEEVLLHHLPVQMPLGEKPFPVIRLMRKREPKLELVRPFLCVLDQLVVKQDVAERVVRVDEADLGGVAWSLENLLDQLEVGCEA